MLRKLNVKDVKIFQHSLCSKEFQRNAQPNNDIHMYIHEGSSLLILGFYHSCVIFFLTVLFYQSNPVFSDGLVCVCFIDCSKNSSILLGQSCSSSAHFSIHQSPIAGSLSVNF